MVLLLPLVVCAEPVQDGHGIWMDMVGREFFKLIQEQEQIAYCILLFMIQNLKCCRCSISVKT